MILLILIVTNLRVLAQTDSVIVSLKDFNNAQAKIREYKKLIEENKRLKFRLDTLKQNKIIETVTINKVIIDTVQINNLKQTLKLKEQSITEYRIALQICRTQNYKLRRKKANRKAIQLNGGNSVLDKY